MSEKLNEMDHGFKEGGFKSKVQSFGRFLSGMVMPNIGAFIAWGFITALFISTGWLPNESLASLVGPMINFLLPILIGYTGGKLVHDTRGGVVGAVATMGVIVGADIPMFLGAMIMGPLGGYIIKKFDEAIHDKIKTGFEMLVNNFSAGILGMGLAIVGFFAIGPVVLGLNNILRTAVEGVVTAGLLPFSSIFIEPAKILFLNNAINHGVLGPLGVQEAEELGKSIFFLLETNPGPGLGILLAYWMFAKGMVKQSAPGAIIIHFFGGIHEIYFPYVLMKPILLLAVIAGGASGVFVFTIFNAGLVATPSPGSIFALMAMTPRGNFLGVLSGVIVSTAVSFLVASFFIKGSKEPETDLDEAKAKVSTMKKKSKGQTGLSVTKEPSEIKKVVFACDAGMGSSAMGASSLKKKFKERGLTIDVTNAALDELTDDVDLIVTHENLAPRAKKAVPTAEIVTIKNFVGSPVYDELAERLSQTITEQTTQSDEASDESTTDAGILKENNIILGLPSESMEASVKRAGKLLVDDGYVEEDYIDGMLEREEVTSTYIGNGVAIPHGVNEVKDAINKSGIVFLQYPEGIDFGVEDKTYLVIGIAGKGNEHLKILANLANSLEEEAIVEQLKSATDPKEILEILNK